MTGRAFDFKTLAKRQRAMKRGMPKHRPYMLPEPLETAPWPPTRRLILALARARRPD
jgi:hypothetical protein